MLYCINLLRDGFLPALLGFFIWRYGAHSMSPHNIKTHVPFTVCA
jgi:hypothetical protein